MQDFRLVAGAVGALLAAAGFTADTVSAQPFAPNTPMPRVSHIGVQPYMRIPTGSRAESAALKADQDAAKLSIRSQKVKKRR